MIGRLLNGFTVCFASVVTLTGTANAADVFDCRNRNIDRLILKPTEEFSRSFQDGIVWMMTPKHGRSGVNIMVLAIGADPSARASKIVAAGSAFDRGWAQFVMSKAEPRPTPQGSVRVHIPVQMFSTQDQIWDVAEIVVDREALSVRALGL